MAKTVFRSFFLSKRRAVVTFLRRLTAVTVYSRLWLERQADLPRCKIALTALDVSSVSAMGLLVAQSALAL